jgi:hypothetical protein
VLIHIDDHEDIGIKNPFWTYHKHILETVQPTIELQTIDDVIRHCVCTESDPTGIGSFIATAAFANFLGAFFWVYGYGPAAPRDESYTYKGSTGDIFEHGAWRYLYRNLPFELIERVSRDCAPGKRILDCDIDAAVTTDSLRSIVRPHLARPNWILSMTIALSPQFGPRLNHVKKVMMILGLLRSPWIRFKI